MARYDVQLSKTLLKDTGFVKELTSQYYVTVPNALLLGYAELKPQEKFCFIHLMRFGLLSLMNGYGTTNNPDIFPSQETLAGLLGVDRSTVSRYIKALEKSGLVSVEYRGLGDTNLITLNPPIDKKPVIDSMCIHAHPDVHTCTQYNKEENKNIS